MTVRVWLLHLFITVKHDLVVVCFCHQWHLGFFGIIRIPILSVSIRLGKSFAIVVFVTRVAFTLAPGRTAARNRRGGWECRSWYGGGRVCLAGVEGGTVVMHRADSLAGAFEQTEHFFLGKEGVVVNVCGDGVLQVTSLKVVNAHARVTGRRFILCTMEGRDRQSFRLHQGLAQRQNPSRVVSEERGGCM